MGMTKIWMACYSVHIEKASPQSVFFDEFVNMKFLKISVDTDYIHVGVQWNHAIL